MVTAASCKVRITEQTEAYAAHILFWNIVRKGEVPVHYSRAQTTPSKVVSAGCASGVVGVARGTYTWLVSLAV